jgi:hypothetical protein
VDELVGEGGEVRIGVRAIDRGDVRVLAVDAVLVLAAHVEILGDVPVVIVEPLEEVEEDRIGRRVLEAAVVIGGEGAIDEVGGPVEQSGAADHGEDEGVAQHADADRGAVHLSSSFDQGVDLRLERDGRRLVHKRRRGRGRRFGEELGLLRRRRRGSGRVGARHG